MRTIILLAMGLTFTNVYSQVGINTGTPQKTFHVNGSLQVVNELNVGGTSSTAGSAGIAGQVLKSSGPGAAPTWQNIAGVPNSTGTVIVVNGEFIVAQEIVVQLTADYMMSGATAFPIGNLSNEIIDNENRYFGNATANSFTIPAHGIYQVTMNAQLSTTNGTSSVIGIWNDTTNKWVARVNDYFTAPTGDLQTYTLLTSISMMASHKYSFRIANTANTTVKFISSGSIRDPDLLLRCL